MIVNRLKGLISKSDLRSHVSSRPNSVIVLTCILTILLIILIGVLMMLGSSFRQNGAPADPELLEDFENMQFIAYKDRREYAIGRSFSPDLFHFIEDWEISDGFSYELKPIEASSVTFVTYSSSLNFAKARNGIRSMRSLFKNKIIFYDLGLKKEEVDELNRVCNLEVRKLDFARFPDFESRLMRNHFKPIIMAEVFREFEHYWLVDSSVRFFNINPSLLDFYANVTSGAIEPMALRHPTLHSVFAATHPDMYNYLPVEESLAKSLEMLNSNMVFIARSDFSREAAKWHALCALTPDCLAPKDAHVHCPFSEDRYRKYANCHSYDQSSINIIVSSLLERDGWTRRDRVNDDSMSEFSSLNPDEIDERPLFIPCR